MVSATAERGNDSLVLLLDVPQAPVFRVIRLSDLAAREVLPDMYHVVIFPGRQAHRNTLRNWSEEAIIIARYDAEDNRGLPSPATCPSCNKKAALSSGSYF